MLFLSGWNKLACLVEKGKDIKMKPEKQNSEKLADYSPKLPIYKLVLLAILREAGRSLVDDLVSVTRGRIKIGDIMDEGLFCFATVDGFKDGSALFDKSFEFGTSLLIRLGGVIVRPPRLGEIASLRDRLGGVSPRFFKKLPTRRKVPCMPPFFFTLAPFRTRC